MSKALTPPPSSFRRSPVPRGLGGYRSYSEISSGRCRCVNPTPSSSRRSHVPPSPGGRGHTAKFLLADVNPNPHRPFVGVPWGVGPTENFFSATVELQPRPLTPPPSSLSRSPVSSAAGVWGVGPTANFVAGDVECLDPAPIVPLPESRSSPAGVSPPSRWHRRGSRTGAGACRLPARRLGLPAVKAEWDCSTRVELALLLGPNSLHPRFRSWEVPGPRPPLHKQLIVGGGRW
jgi:hypothetical protein